MENNYFNSHWCIYRAAKFWYGKTDIDHLRLAENRLARGEVPEVLRVN